MEQFLSERFHNRAPNFAMLRAPDVTGFVMRHARQLSPMRARLMVTALRSFFRYRRYRGFFRLPRWSVFWSAAIKRRPSDGGTMRSCCCSPGSAYALGRLVG